MDNYFLSRSDMRKSRAAAA